MERREQPRARVVADSVAPDGARLTTIEVTLHRFVLAELNTHRAFSRNSASSRAIPVRRLINAVRTAPAVPLEFGSARSGMQAGPVLEDDSAALATWMAARDAAADAAERLLDLGVHKQVANRLLEPFLWQTVIVSATDWDGFWEQRCSPLAQPEIRAAATAMREARRASVPLEVDGGGWHLPYLLREEMDIDPKVAVRISAARCARVSYLTHDGIRDPALDLELYDKLVGASPPHSSPLEHVATPALPDRPAAGNLKGWVQLRQLVLSGGGMGMAVAPG
ncbi:MAG: FAD-dependent thymidylate synthase [Candidatus Dormiibacterota bacterium]